jgi:hypothetical protein
MQSVILQLAKQDPVVPWKLKGVKVKLVSQPQEVPESINLAPSGQEQALLIGVKKESAHLLQTLSELHSIQLATPQVKHLLSYVLRVNPVWHFKQVPVKSLHSPVPQLAGHS